MTKTQVRATSRVMSTTLTPMFTPKVSVTCALQCGVISHSSLLSTLDTQTHELTSKAQPVPVLGREGWAGGSEAEEALAWTEESGR